MIWARRAFSVLLICLISVVLLEGVLQLAAVVVHLTGRDAVLDVESRGMKVLALGDSNTYGLYYPEDKAWPAQLEVFWNTHFPDDPIQVMNLGYPGTNSARVRANFQGIVSKTKPDWVFVLIGNNDFWTPLEVPGENTVGTAKQQPGLLQFVRDHSRVYKLVFMLGRSAQMHDVQSAPRMILDEEILGDVEKQKAFAAALHAPDVNTPANSPATEPVDNQLVIDGESFPMTLSTHGPRGKIKYLQPNLKAMLDHAKAQHIGFVLLTYPSSNNFYPRPSSEIRQFAMREKVPLIDLQKHFQQVCHGDVECHDYFLVDAHPNARGYEEAAKYIAGRFASILDGQQKQEAQ